MEKLICKYCTQEFRHAGGLATHLNRCNPNKSEFEDVLESLEESVEDIESGLRTIEDAVDTISQYL